MLSFFRRKEQKCTKLEDIKEAKQIDKNKLLKEVAMEVIRIDTIWPEVIPLTLTDIESMIRYLDISTPVLSISRGVCSRDIKLVREDGEENDETLKEIRGRFNRINGWADFIRNLSLTPYYGYSCFEKIYNDDFSLKRVQYIPRQLIRYDRLTMEWYIGGVNQYEMCESKFLLSRYAADMEYPEGNSLFNYGLYQAWKDIENLEAKVRGLAEKYGSVIPVFGFDPEDTETDEGKIRLQDRAEQIKALTDKNALAIPLDGEHSLKDSFHYISLADLKPEMHKILLERLETKIEKFIKGSTFSEGVSGSQAKDKVQQSEKEKIEDDIAVFMAGQLHDLLKADALFFGYESSDYKWTFELEEGEAYKEDLSKKKAETKTEKIKAFTEAKNLGYKVKKQVIAETLGVDIKDLEEIEDSIPTPIPTPVTGSEFAETKKKRIELYIDRVIKNEESFSALIEKYKKPFTKQVYTQALKQFKKKNTIDELVEGFTYNLQEFQESLIIGALYGVIDDIEMDQLEEFAEEEFDPFDLPFDEAIAAFIERSPELYSTISKVTEEIRQQFTWIKRSTELETTLALMKNLERNLQAGGTFKDWLKASEDVLKNSGFGEDGWYLELVYRNNQHTAYNTGQFIQQEENKENKPYAMYSGIDDNRQTALCGRLDGLVYTLDNPFWDQFMPPNHHGCRSRRIALSKDDLEEYGVNASRVAPKNLEGLKGYDKKWLTNPGKGVKSSIKQKEKDIDKLSEKLKGEIDD